jgi:hypothetical protein
VECWLHYTRHGGAATRGKPGAVPCALPTRRCNRERILN